MNNWNKLGRKLLFPPVWVILLLTVFSAGSLTVVFLRGWEEHPVAYAVYVIAFYWLTVFCVACWKVLPGYICRLKTRVHQNPHAHRYLTDTEFRTHVSLYLSLAINLLYVATNAVSAFVYSTNWFGIFALYYTVMAVMHFLLVRYVRRNGLRKNRTGELRRARACAWILMTVNLALSGAVLMMIYFGRGFQYRGMLIYVMALYTFWITTAAVVDLCKYRKYSSPVMSMSKIIKLAAAMVSMLSLETAMFAQFGGDMDPRSQQIMIMATGGGIAVIVSVMSVYMIVRTTQELWRLKHSSRTE